MYISIEEIKKHLNIDSTFTEDDEYLKHLYEVAEKVVSKHIDNSLMDYVSEGKLDSGLRHAILLYVGDLYNSREGNAYGVSVSEVPFSYDYILSLYKNYNGKIKK